MVPSLTMENLMIHRVVALVLTFEYTMVMVGFLLHFGKHRNMWHLLQAKNAQITLWNSMLPYLRRNICCTSSGTDVTRRPMASFYPNLRFFLLGIQIWLPSKATQVAELQTETYVVCELRWVVTWKGQCNKHRGLPLDICIHSEKTTAGLIIWHVWPLPAGVVRKNILPQSLPLRKAMPVQSSTALWFWIEMES
jgi:hypothetical protein